MINDAVDQSIIESSMISSFVETIYQDINTTTNNLFVNRLNGHKVDISIRQGKKVIVLAHGFGSAYAKKVLNSMNTTLNSYYRLILIAPTISNLTYTNYG